jgi:acetylornithine deacetylase/succinyl-diaminopimelate desuccinylase-like protein
MAQGVDTAEGASGAVRAWRREHEGAVLGELVEFLSIPNVAGDAAGMDANAAWIRGALERRGLRTELWRAAGDAAAPAAVFGELDVGADRTVGIYAHYDGQPCDAERWTAGPWEPAVFDGRVEDGAGRVEVPGAGGRAGEDWRVYARSASDDKAPVVAFCAALDALAASGGGPAVNIRVLIEGEEEVTSPNLAGHIARHRGALDGCDVWLFCDGPCDTFGERHVAFGVRGDVELELCVWGPVHEVHSGHFGNFAMNPAMELARLLGSMKGADGRVLIDGFEAAGSASFDDAERAAIAEAEGVDGRLLAFLGAGGMDGDGTAASGVSYFERLMRPSLNVRGLRAAGVEGEARNVVPGWAKASVDIRSASSAHPHALVDLLERHAAGMGFFVLDREPTAAERRRHGRLLTVRRDCGYPASRTGMGGVAARAVTAAVERASRSFDGGRLLKVPMLGSSMPMHAFASGLGVPVVVTPMANADSNQHSVDENIRVGHLWWGIEMLAGLLSVSWDG